MVFAIIGGQALSILRPTGPVVVRGHLGQCRSRHLSLLKPARMRCATLAAQAFIAVVFQQSEVYDVDFLKLWAWTGLWGMVCMLIMSVCDMAALVRYVTNFTEDVHNALIATIFIVEVRHAAGWRSRGRGVGGGPVRLGLRGQRCCVGLAEP